MNVIVNTSWQQSEWEQRSANKIAAKFWGVSFWGKKIWCMVVWKARRWQKPEYYSPDVEEWTFLVLKYEEDEKKEKDEWGFIVFRKPLFLNPMEYIKFWNYLMSRWVDITWMSLVDNWKFHLNNILIFSNTTELSKAVEIIKKSLFNAGWDLLKCVEIIKKEIVEILS